MSSAIRSLPRGARNAPLICQRCPPSHTRSLSTVSRIRRTTVESPRQAAQNAIVKQRTATLNQDISGRIIPLSSCRSYATTDGPSVADQTIEQLTDLFMAARDEFELASEETDNNTVYAADDRAAAQEEFARFRDVYEGALAGPHSEEVRRRIGARVRELENAMQELERRGMEG